MPVPIGTHTSLLLSFPFHGSAGPHPLYPGSLTLVSKPLSGFPNDLSTPIRGDPLCRVLDEQIIVVILTDWSISFSKCSEARYFPSGAHTYLGSPHPGSPNPTHDIITNSREIRFFSSRESISKVLSPESSFFSPGSGREVPTFPDDSLSQRSGSHPPRFPGCVPKSTPRLIDSLSFPPPTVTSTVFAFANASLSSCPSSSHHLASFLHLFKSAFSLLLLLSAFLSNALQALPDLFVAKPNLDAPVGIGCADPSVAFETLATLFFFEILSFLCPHAFLLRFSYSLPAHSPHRLADH